MRLTEQEQLAIIAAVREVMGSETEVWLFGSRTEDTAHGGDIDLYIESPALDNPVKRRIELKLALYDRLGEQKIDIVHHLKSEPALPIHQHARATGVRLT